MNTVYFLDDGTGRMEGRLWTENNNDEESFNDRGIKCVQVFPFSMKSPTRQNISLREQSYARITGSLKNFGSKRYLHATNVRPCDDPHELYYHMMEVIFVSLALQRGHVSIILSEK